MDALAGLWRQAELDARALDAVTLTGADPVLPSSFRIGAAAQAAIAAAGLAAAEIHRRRGGPAQRVSVAMRDAAIEFRSERYYAVDGKAPPDPWDSIAGLYPTAGGGFVRLHTNFPHHRAGVLRLLGCAPERDAVAAALLGWDAARFETTAAEAGMAVSAARGFADWDAHPQGQAVAGLPALSIERIGDAPPRPLPPLAARPLAGLRVLDLTRVIAGPVAARTLAAHGAEVLHVTAPHLPALPALLPDTGRGKRTASLDLRDADQAATLAALARGADVFLQGYRPGALAGLGFGPERLAALNPGIVCVSLSAYGHRGPWAARHGFDSLTQTATGINWAEAEAAGEAMPRALPCQALDHASGYLLALGAMAALLRRAEEGGSWLVRVSLAGTGHWLRGLGAQPGGMAAPDLRPDDVRDRLDESDSGFGRLTAVRHAAELDRTPAHWALPAMPLGSHAAAWGTPPD
jgi:crotonobetainyl-CoA:carnitine CoA-transferase CaiB-like acyl-CoA transferase